MVRMQRQFRLVKGTLWSIMFSIRLAVILLLGLTFLDLTPAQSQNNDCLTPSSGQGICISILNCEYLANLIRNVPTPSNLELVQKSRCAFLPGTIYPQVCCPNSSTPPTPPPTPPPEEKEHPNLYLLAIEECGVASSDRIIGGNVTALDEFPWTALLEYERKDGSKTFACGGVLINNRYVLTAAHCTTRYVRKLNYRLVNIRLGEHNIDTERDCNEYYCTDAPVDFGIEEEISHPNYTSNKHNYNDIALIRLNNEVTMSDYIKAICIPTENEVLSKNFTGQRLTVTGWGKTGDQSGRSSPVKLKVKVPVVDNEECARTYNLQGGKIHVTEDQICAGGSQNKDACGGDSGGPLMDAIYLNHDFQVHFHVIGIVSYGPTCKISENTADQTSIPGVYTRVSSYREWILDNLKP